MRRVKSMLLTLLCSGMILGAGYFAIVESGQKVLEKERILEETAYEDTGSNIFYGKIEENIELFPWGYYPEENGEGTSGEYPIFEEARLQWEGDLEEEIKSSQDWYLCQLIGWESDTSTEEVWEWYDQNQKSIMESMVMVENSLLGSIYFYQDILDLGEKQYQVRVACSGWNIISFICMEHREGQERDRSEWEEGKEKLVGILESSEEEMAEYFDFMIFLNNEGIVSFYNYDEGEYVNAYLESLHWLEEISMNQEYGSEYVPKEVRSLMETWGYSDKAAAGETAGEEKVGADAEYKKNIAGTMESSYSYQILELKDMILLLMQGEQTLGVYYDPIAQRFCGYNFFYEY